MWPTPTSRPSGIVDLVVGVQLGERTMHSIELFGTKVLPRLREL